MEHFRVWPEISSLRSYNTKKIGRGCIFHYLNYPLMLDMKQYRATPLYRFPPKLSTSVLHRLGGVAASHCPVSLIQGIPAEKFCKQLWLCMCMQMQLRIWLRIDRALRRQYEVQTCHFHDAAALSVAIGSFVPGRWRRSKWNEWLVLLHFPHHQVSQPALL